MKAEHSEQNWLDKIGLSIAPAPGGALAGNATTAEWGKREGTRRTAMVLLLVLVLLGPIMTFGGMNLSDEGTVERQTGYVMVLGLSIFAAMPRATRFSLIALSVPMLIALGWCWISLSWSIDPDSSVRRLVLTTTVAWTVFILVRHSEYRSIVDVVRWTLVTAILLSYVVVAADPAIGIHLMGESALPTALVGNWRGFLGHKNFAGAVCALCILLFLFDAKQFPRLLRGTIIVAAAYFLYRSQSKTSMGMLAMAIAGGVIFQSFSRRYRIYLIPLVTICSSLFLAWTSAYSEFLQTNILDPASFTGRGQIWATLLRYAQDHPLGAGFGAFWNIGPHSPVFSYGQGYVTQITVGHSGYLDQLVTVGLPGVMLMAFATMVWPFWKVFSNAALPPARGALIVATLMFCIGHNITETGLFERDAIVSTFLFFAAALAQFTDAGGADPRRRRAETGDDILRVMRARAGAATIA